QSHVVLTSHPGTQVTQVVPIQWGAKDPKKRGPVVAGSLSGRERNAIGAHGGSYAVYRALATASGRMKQDHRPDLHNTEPVVGIGPFPSWYDPKKIVSIDPWGANIERYYGDY